MCNYTRKVFVNVKILFAAWSCKIKAKAMSFFDKSSNSKYYTSLASPLPFTDAKGKGKEDSQNSHNTEQGEQTAHPIAGTSIQIPIKKKFEFTPEELAFVRREMNTQLELTPEQKEVFAKTGGVKEWSMLPTLNYYNNLNLHFDLEKDRVERWRSTGLVQHPVTPREIVEKHLGLHKKLFSESDLEKILSN